MYTAKSLSLITSISLLILGCGGNGGGNRAPVINTPPTLSVVADQNTDANTASDPISVTVADGQTSNDALAVNATSDNQNVVADMGITVSGNGGVRSLVIQPVTDQIGSAVITVNVTDGGGLSSATAFAFTVNAINQSFQQFTRATFADDANATPRSINIVEFTQDAAGDNFADLINP